MMTGEEDNCFVRRKGKEGKKGGKEGTEESR